MHPILLADFNWNDQIDDKRFLFRMTIIIFTQTTPIEFSLATITIFATIQHTNQFFKPYEK